MNVMFWFQSCLNDLDAVGDRFKELINFGLEQLNTSDIKPRIKQLFDTYQTINHKIVEVKLLKYFSAKFTNCITKFYKKKGWIWSIFKC